MKNIAVLGSTGSIGSQTLDIVRDNPELFKVKLMTCGRNVSLFARQLSEFRPEAAAVLDKEDAEKLAESFPDIRILYGSDGIDRLTAETDYDILLNSLVGMAGLRPTLSGINSGRTIALANKETLVAGGAVVMKAAAEKGVDILPVDSEHSAIFQCLQGYDPSQVRKLILTASGGPFRGMKRKDLEKAGLEQALDHPRWKMGSKITIDSSTLMNKGFEVVEASWLFNVPGEKIDVIVHPESIIHSMVEYEDGAVMAQLGMPDMKIPISLALNYPSRLANDMKSPDFAEIARLNFEKPDMDTFPCLDLAYRALKEGGDACTALNAANEVCVNAFLAGKIKYLDISDTLVRVMSGHKTGKADNLESVLETDARVRKETLDILAGLTPAGR